MRVASLLASATEVVCALGAGDMLVGRSHECDAPAWVTRLPALSAPTFDITGSSVAIDERVRAKLRAGEPLYRIDERLLTELAPDVVLTQSHCEVCAVSPADLAHGGASMGATGVLREHILAIQTGTLEGILTGFVDVARAIDRAREGEELVLTCRRRLDAVRAKTRHLSRPTVVCLEWLEPPFAMGNWGPELVEIAGGTCLLGRPGEHSTTTPWEAVREADPDVLVVAPCGFGLERTKSELDVLRAYPGFHELRAVRGSRAFVADGNSLFNRSGPTVIDTAELLAELLHPDVFPRRERAAPMDWELLA
jgi:iron complex transport system substrate-binding protein